jgi:hypothetical protein
MNITAIESTENDEHQSQSDVSMLLNEPGCILPFDINSV